MMDIAPGLGGGGGGTCGKTELGAKIFADQWQTESIHYMLPLLAFERTDRTKENSALESQHGFATHAPAEVPGLQESEGYDTTAVTKNCLKMFEDTCVPERFGVPSFRFSPAGASLRTRLP